MNLHVHLFGRLDVHNEQRQLLTRVGNGKVQELLAFLLLHRGRLHPRETLATLLWPEASIAQAKKYLRKALWQLNHELDAHCPAGESQLLVTDADAIGVDLTTGLWLDVVEFESVCTRTREVAGEALDVCCVEMLQQALQFYRGDLLAGWYQDWCLYDRERLHDIYLGQLDKLIAYHEARCDYETAIRYATEVLRHDRASERTHCHLMRLHYRRGDRTAALHQFKRCCIALRDDLDVQPRQLTLRLYEQIRADVLDLPESADAWPALPSPDRLSMVLGRLRQIQSDLSQTQHRVEQEIQTVEALLRR
jgi:DNA-binding SARP family transcriptional activator